MLKCLPYTLFLLTNELILHTPDPTILERRLGFYIEHIGVAHILSFCTLKRVYSIDICAHMSILQSKLLISVLVMCRIEYVG